MSKSKEVIPELQQSANWDKYKDTSGSIREGFPFNEGYPNPYFGKEFEIICLDGVRLSASVDDSRQYRDEGVSWKTNKGELVYGHTVVAWREQVIQPNDNLE